MDLLGSGSLVSPIGRPVGQLYPGAVVYLVGEEHRLGKLWPFYAAHSWADEMITCPDRDTGSFREWWRFYRTLKTYRLDLCVMSANNCCSNSLFLYLCGIPRIVGPVLPETWPWHGNIENRFITRQL